MSVSIVWQASSGKTACAIRRDDIEWASDIGVATGGSGTLPDPHDLLDSSLGACTALTLELYAKRKQMALTGLRITVTHHEEQGMYRLHREIAVEGNLNEQERANLLRIANACPIHKVLSGSFQIDTELAG